MDNIVLKTNGTGGYVTTSAIYFDSKWYDLGGKEIPFSKSLKRDKIIYRIRYDKMLPIAFVPLSEAKLMTFTTMDGKRVVYVTYDRYETVKIPSLLEDSESFARIIYEERNGDIKIKTIANGWGHAVTYGTHLYDIIVKNNFFGSKFLKNYIEEENYFVRKENIKKERRLHWEDLTGNPEWGKKNCDNLVVPLIGYNRHFATVEYGSEMQDYDDWGFDSIEVVEPIPQYGYLGIKSLPVGVNPANYYFCTLQGTDEWYYCPKNIPDNSSKVNFTLDDYKKMMEEKESRANENSQSRRQKFADKAKGYRYAIFWHSDSCDENPGMAEIFETDKIPAKRCCDGHYDGFCNTMEEAEKYIEDNMLNIYE